MDIVFINDLHIDTIIGIFEWEREVRQTVSLNIEMAHDIRKAAETDNIDFALDYKKVSKRLIKFVGESEFMLVETMAEQVADIIQHEFHVPWLRLSVSKPGALRGAQSVGIRIERGVRS